MEYKKKVEFAETAAGMFKKGLDIEEIVGFLEVEGVDKWDVDKIIKSSKSILKNEYSEIIKGYMLDGSLGNHLDDFDELSSELFEEIQHEQIDQIIRNASIAVRQHLRVKMEYGDISNEVVNEYFTQAHLNEVIDNFEQKTQKKEKLRLTGYGAVALGVVLTLGSRSFLDNSIVVFSGLIIYGIWALFKSTSIRVDE